MPLFLFWYILRDLLKLLVVSTTILVIVISFGAAIQPLAEGLIGPWRLIYFIILAMPPMLQFALPFAAAFSATIVYHRLAQDNELAACSASGVSYANLLLPAATLGVILTISLSILTNYACPKFWELMNRTAHLDAPEFFIRSVERGEPIQEDNLLIRATAVTREELPPDSKSYAALRVYGLLFMVLDHGDVEAIGTAPQGVFYLTRIGSDTVVTSVFEDLVVLSGKKDLLRTEESRIPPMIFPSTFKDSPKFMNVSELHQIIEQPERFPKVAQKLDDFKVWLAKRHLYMEINQDLATSGRAILHGQSTADGSTSDLRVEIYGSRLQRIADDQWKILPEATNAETGEPGNVRIYRYRGMTPDAMFISSSPAVMKPHLRSILIEPSVGITLRNARATDLANDVTTTHDSVSLSRFYSNQAISAELRDLSLATLVERADNSGDGEVVNSLRREVNRECDKVERNILSRIHERTALSVSGLVMMLLGATMAIWLRGALPLTVYFWSIVPAIVGLILISTGTDLVRDLDAPRSAGLMMTWSGNLMMAICILMVYRSVRRT